MRRFVVRLLLSTLAAWAGSALIPGITTDGTITTFLLFGLFVAVGEVALPIVEGGLAVVLFFLPRGLRRALLRAGIVAIAASLVSGFGVSGSPVIAIAGLTVFLSLLFMLPFAS